MLSLITTSKAQKLIAEHCQQRRVSIGLTQKGLAKRAGVSLSSLRRFEQEGAISLESFLKLFQILGSLDELITTIATKTQSFDSIDDVLDHPSKPKRKRGWRQ
jgi:transcriptional regulator with XRE-family HTH domain